MRILYLIDNYSLGGAQTIVRGLMEGSEDSMAKYALALRQKEPEMHIDHPNATVFPSSSKYTFRVMRFLKDFISENNIEILHCQLPRSMLMGYLLKRSLPDLKYIIHEQGDVFESRAYAMLLRVFRKKADGIMACSEATAEKLAQRSLIDPGKITVLYNFVDLNRFEAGNAPPSTVRKIGFAGRIERRKGWREFIRVAPLFQERKDLSFHIAGTGTELSKLTRTIEKQKDCNIVYRGYIAEMKAFYQEMDLLLIPSHFEPMGMVAVEAMACGIPVLAADVPGLNEVVRHQVNGWTYPAGSVSELRRGIEIIMDCDPDKRRAVINQGIEDARKFSLLEFSRKLQDFYTSLS